MMNIVCVDLFCGIGGLTHGLIKSGINVRAGFDIDESCAYAYKTNNRNTQFFGEDVAFVSGERIKELFYDAEFSMLAGCAPCQPFSTNTIKSSAGILHKTWPLLRGFGKLIVKTLPDVVIMENVPRLAQYEIFNEFVSTLNTHGYQVTVMPNLYCPDYGIPQHRRRLVLLASRHGKIEELTKTHTKATYQSVRQIIADLPPIAAGATDPDDPLHTASNLSEINKQRILISRPGGTWREWPKHLITDCHKKPSGRSYASVYGRMSWDVPAPTITTRFFGFGNGRFGHPEQHRALSIREGALLQSFPRDYVFLQPGERQSFEKLGRWIGNAVPPQLGVHIGKQIKAHLHPIKPDA